MSNIDNLFQLNLNNLLKKYDTNENIVLIFKGFSYNQIMYLSNLKNSLINADIFIDKCINLKKIDDNFAFVEEQHRQATLELSKSKHLSNESYRKWNISAYKYNPSKHRYEFDEKLGRSADVPKYIKER